MRLLTLLGLSLAVVVAGCGGSGQQQGSQGRLKAWQPNQQAASPAQLAAKNYEVLSASQTRLLLGWAKSFHACMAKHLDIGVPRPLRTRIVMALPAAAVPGRVVRLGIACGAKLGDPPPGSSLQTRKHVIVLYLPRYCILDRKVVPRTANG